MPAAKLFEFVVENRIDHEIIEVDDQASLYDISVLENNTHCERVSPTLLRIDDRYVNAILSANHVIDTNEIRKILGKSLVEKVEAAEPAAIAAHDFLVDSRLIAQNSKLAVRLEESGKLLKICCHNFVRIARPHIVHMTAAPAYKTKLGYVSPKARQKSLADIDRCMLGISLENSNFMRPKLLSMIEWISNRFDHCNVVVGDSIHRITLAANGMPAEEARIRALQLGDDFIEREKNCFAAFSDRCNFTFTRCSEAQQQARYHEMHRTLIELHQTSEAFRDSILGFAQSYHQKPRHTLQEQQWQQRMISSRDYFLEEFAILACLQEQGWPVLAYPGSFSTLDDIAEGRISGAPPPLEALMLACLHIKKR